MAGIFNPQLGGNAAAFSPPVNQPSGVSAVAGLVSGFVSTIPEGTKTTPKTGDEFDARWRAAQSLDQWVTKLDPNNPNVHKNTNEFANWYVRQFPQDATKVNSLVTGIENRLDPLDASMLEFSKTPEGIAAAEAAKAKATSPDGTVDQTSFRASFQEEHSIKIADEAAQTKVDRMVAKGESTNKVSDARWKASTVKFTNNTFNTVSSLQGVALALEKSDSVELTDTQMSGLLASGVRLKSNVITRSDAHVILPQIRETLSNGYLNSLNSSHGNIQAAPDTTLATIMAPLDSFIATIDDNFGNATKVEAAATAIANTDLWRQFEEDGLAEVLRTGLLLKEITALTVVTEQMGTDVVASAKRLNIDKMTTTDAISAVEKGSVEQAENSFALSTELLNNPENLDDKQYARVILDVFSNSAKTNPDAIFGDGLWKQLQTSAFATAVGTDPELANWFDGKLEADLNRTRLQAQGELGATALVNVEADGTLSFTFPETGTQEGSTPFDKLVGGASGEQFRKLDEPARKEREQAAIDRANRIFKDFNMKVNTLKTLGDFGSQIIDSVTTGTSRLEGGTGTDVLLPSLKEQGISSGFGLIKSKEGFREKAYWDVNHWRVGYGSDSITKADGTVVEVTEQTTTTRADADRDLERRYSIFQAGASRKIGTDIFNAYPEDTKQALTSIAYNYGSIPDRLIAAARSGDLNALATAVEGLANDNSGINSQRRFEEASLIRGAGNTLTAGGSMSFPAPKNRAEADLSGSQTALNVPSAASSIDQATTPAQSTPEAPVTVDVAVQKIPRATLDKLNRVGRTRVGRKTFPEEGGGVYSEKTVTVPFRGKWVTFPSVLDNSGTISSEEDVIAYLEENGNVDPVTGEEFPIFNSVDEAVEYAKQRSASLLEGNDGA